jgi:hypothetical protein
VPSCGEANSGSFARSAGWVDGSAREQSRFDVPKEREEGSGLESPLNGAQREKQEGRGRRVGVKYCGGCNPRYDRVSLVEDLKARLGREIEWVSPEDDDLDLVLAIEGCQTACADLAPFEGIEIRVFTCPDEAEGFILEMEGAARGVGQCRTG